MSSELLNIDDPLLPRLREAAIRNDEAHRWLLESARRWARGEFFRREQGREPTLDGDYQERLRSLAYKQVAVLTQYPMFAGAITIERIKVGLLLPDTTDEYLKMMVGRTETFGALLSIYDIIELAPEFRTRKWPTDNDLPRTARLEAERKRTLTFEGEQPVEALRRQEGEHGVDADAWARMQGVLLREGDSITLTETITYG